MMKIDNFFAELKRRNVYRVAVAYIVGGWALSQGIAQVFPVFDVPTWAIRLLEAQPARAGNSSNPHAGRGFCDLATRTATGQHSSSWIRKSNLRCLRK
jgi:hypothetical protein